MDANAIYATVAVGIFVILCVVSWYLIQTLRQVQRTALAVEDLLAVTRPRIEAASEQLASLVGRADRLLASVEEGRGTAAGVMDMVRHALAGWTTTTQIISSIAAAVAAAVQAWSALTRPKGSPDAGEGAAGAAAP